MIIWSSKSAALGVISLFFRLNQLYINCTMYKFVNEYFYWLFYKVIFFLGQFIILNLPSYKTYKWPKENNDICSIKFNFVI